MALCNVTGTLYLPTGERAGDYDIFLQRTDKRVTADYLGSVVPQMVRVLTSQTGTVDFDILTGTYRGVARPRNMVGTTVGYEFAFTVPDAATASFDDCIGAASVPPAPPVWYTQALAARDEAVDAAASAESSAEAIADMLHDVGGPGVDGQSVTVFAFEPSDEAGYNAAVSANAGNPLALVIRYAS